MALTSRPNYITWTGLWFSLTIVCVCGQLVLQPQKITRTRRQLAPNINVHQIPKTSFSCDDKKLGEYYADTETHCQVYHICLPSTGPRLHAMSFVCPNGTIFSQANRACNFYDKVHCDISARFYETLHGDPHSRREDYGDPNDYTNLRLPNNQQRPRSQNALEDANDSDDYEDEIPERTTRPPPTQRNRSNRNRQQSNSRRNNQPPPPVQTAPPPPPPVRPQPQARPPQRSFRPPPLARGPQAPPEPPTTTTPAPQIPPRRPFPGSRLPPGLRVARPAEESEPSQSGPGIAPAGQGVAPVPIAIRPSGFRPPLAGLRPAPGAARPAPIVTRSPTTTTTPSPPTTTTAATTVAVGQPYEYDYELDYTYEYPPGTNAGARLSSATRTKRSAAPSKKGGRYPSVVDTSRPHIDTNFTCQGKLSGFVYADVETECEMFHICVPVGKGKLFDYRLFCAPGTAFNQRSGICENKLTFDCSRTEKYYRHDKIGRYFSGLKPEQDQKKFSRVERETREEPISTTKAPTTTSFPKTRFSCEGKTVGGYYADPDTGCQMFHICAPLDNGRPIDLKFLCSNGTVFNQKTLVCDQDGQVACSKSESYYVNSFTHFLDQERRRLDEEKIPIQDIKVELYRKERT